MTQNKSTAGGDGKLYIWGQHSPSPHHHQIKISAEGSMATTTTAETISKVPTLCNGIYLRMFMSPCEGVRIQTWVHWMGGQRERWKPRVWYRVLNNRTTVEVTHDLLVPGESVDFSVPIYSTPSTEMGTHNTVSAEDTYNSSPGGSRVEYIH